MKESKEQLDNLTRIVLHLPASRRIFTKSQRSYADVRRAIVEHDLPATTPLDESLLLSLFPVGRTPLREALKKLTTEGLLSWPAHQAPSIRDVGVQEMQYLYETRRMLEPTIARLAARRAITENHNQMLDYCQKLSDASATGNIYESVEMDYALHTAIARASQNRFLSESSDLLNLQSLRLWYRAQKAHGISTIDVMHARLVEVIIRGDESAAEALAMSHIESSLTRQRQMLGDFGVVSAR